MCPEQRNRLTKAFVTLEILNGDVPSSEFHTAWKAMKEVLDKHSSIYKFECSGLHVVTGCAITATVEASTWMEARDVAVEKLGITGVIVKARINHEPT